MPPYFQLRNEKPSGELSRRRRVKVLAVQVPSPVGVAIVKAEAPELVPSSVTPVPQNVGPFTTKIEVFIR